jgi:hypothetical protein
MNANERQVQQPKSRFKFGPTPPAVGNELVRSSGSLGGKFPLLLTPEMDGVDLVAWISDRKEWLRGCLYRYGAVLFRGFQIYSEDAFSEFVTSCEINRLEYMEGATPRTRIGDGVYTSTEFPASETIALHNELTYVRNWPTRIVFCCLQPAESGGETPIADVRDVLKRIDPEIVESFRAKGWMLVRNFSDGIGLSWKNAFHTDDRDAVQQYCQENDISYEWQNLNHLRTVQARQAISRHPVTAEEVWFNHIAFWHVSSLRPGLRSVFVSEFGERGLPFNTYYGDGSAIDDRTIGRIRDAFDTELVTFPWNRGDVLLLDNMLIAHGRRPYQGARRVIVAMGDGINMYGKKGEI